MLVIILFILILNIVSILLMYRTLTDRTPKEKLVFIAIGIALMYMLTSFVYWISTRNIEITEVSDVGKDLIIFLFVPINSIILLPIFARSYCKYKDGGINGTVFRNRGIVLGVILLILLIIECSYFENIQNQVVKMITDKNNQVEQETANQLEVEQSNIITNDTTDSVNQIANTLESNEVDENNSIENEMDENTKQTNENNTVNEVIANEMANVTE